jgi:hypothetical protein
MEQLILLIPNLLGIDPEAFTLYLILLVTVSNVVSKLIPESSTGVLGVIRKIASILGVSLANRITPNVTSKDISKAVAAGIPDAVVKEAADALPSAVETGQAATALADAIVDAGIPATTAGDKILNQRRDMPYVGGE